jgi:hypothetical protein
MKTLFLFLDGVGLGADDPTINPLARADMPHLQALLGGRKLIAASAPYHGARASLIAIDACLGVDGLPQSATGQAVLLTGINVPKEIGYHYGPKPNPDVAAFLKADTIFHRVAQSGKRAALLNAYPPRYFHGIESGKRIYSSIPMAVTNAGLNLFTQEDYFAGRALAVDFTGEGWRTMLKIDDAPVFDAETAGRNLARLALQYDFSMFEYWPSDYAGHGQDMEKALKLLGILDEVIGGMLEDGGLKTEGRGPKTEDRGRRTEEELLIVITSDHGNMEDLSTRRHTDAKVPCLLIGSESARKEFADGLEDLTGVFGAIWRSISSTDFIF